MMYFQTFFNSRRAFLPLLLLLLLFCLSFSALKAQAAVTVDNSSASGAFNAAGVSTLSWTHETGAGSNRALFVGVSTSTTTLPVGIPTERVASVTYNGIALTRVGTAVSPNSLNTSEIFRLVNPPTGANTVEVTLGSVIGNPFVNYVVGGAITFQGVSQATPNGTFFPASGNSSSPTVIVADSVSGDFVLDTLAVSPSAAFIAPSVGQLQRWDGQPFFMNSFDIGAGSTEPAVSPATTMSWITSVADNWALGAVAVRQFITTAASVSVGGRLTTPNNRGVGNARVKMIDANGNSRVVITSPFGYYRFENVQVGEVYTFTVESKQYGFEPRAVFVGEELNNLDFISKQ